MTGSKFLNEFEAAMERFQSQDTTDLRRQEYLSTVNNCSLCGSNLELSHTIELEGSMIREEARCPHCEIKTRNKIFNMQ